MSFKHLIKYIKGDAPGSSTELNYFHIGPKTAEKKVYLQAALHANEQPGIMVLHHLLALLKEADDKNLLNARFVVFPMVNPLGMADISFYQHQGRYDRASATNHNRQWPDLAHAIRDQIADKLSADMSSNVLHIRRAIKHWLDSNPPNTALEQQRHFALLEAYDADYVFDLHCDAEALLHIFSVPQINDQIQVLSNWIGAKALLTAENSGGGSFDEVWPGLWLNLAKAFPDHPIPLSVISATIEYRGEADTFDNINKDDAHRLFAYFQTEGLIIGKCTITPHEGAAPTQLNATELLRADQSGLLAYQVELGSKVNIGDTVADLIILNGEEAFTKRIPLKASTRGRVISRSIHKYVWPGCSIAKIVGTKPLESRSKYLLED